MTTYMELKRCQLLCACQRTSPLSQTYFCRHCLDIRCSACVSHEVDSHYCPNCLENMASAEAKMRKHRCGNCFDCPSCGHTLSTRATAVMLAKPDEPGKTVAQKAYYLTCGFCRWSTRDSGIPDQRQSAGGWPETTSPHAKRIMELIDSYHHLAVKEKADREWSKFVRKRNYMILLERYPVLNPRLRRYCSSSWTTPNRETEPAKKVTIPAAEVPDEPVTFDLDPYVNQPLQLEKITTVHQRHLAPQTQPKLTAELEPRLKCLVVKRSMRCRTCEHNLSKADFNPSSIKFRINLSAMYHVPELRYILPTPTAEAQQSASSDQPPDLSVQRRTSTTLAMLKSQRLIHHHYTVGKTHPVILTLCNPAHRVTTVSLRQLTAEEEAKSLRHLVFDQTISKADSTLTSSSKVTSQATVEDSGDAPIVGSSGDAEDSLISSSPCFSTVKLTLPSGEIKLAPRNDIADYDENLTSNVLVDCKDDPKLIAFRRANKVGIHVGLTPLTDVKFRKSTFCSLSPLMENDEDDQHDDGSELSANLMPLRAALSLRFDYKNTATSLLSEQRAATAAAAAASASATSAVKVGLDAVDPNKPVSLGTSPAVTPGDQINQIELTVLLNFGEMVVSAS
ncbi:hypothetical protein EG68_04899 [Paragonimus skrjabini miyazakii]|uniref:Dynactin subunit 4 n=1 Tax=Paragonimus skrjabini miyazakii TaxID=59628 RepID=A0A8S9YMC3_9TREM|nr:hypothetical protein EG68_04899 [Paragonimus skrjabini miyazakii]